MSASEIELRPTPAKLLALFRRGAVLTQDEIVDQLPISSKRQARRTLTRLKDKGLPVESRRRGSKKEFLLPPEEWEAGGLGMSEREVLSLLLAAGAARSGLGPAPLEEALGGAFDRLVEEIPRSVGSFDPDSLMGQLHFGEAASVDVDPDVFMAVFEALSDRRSIEIDYYSASSDTRYPARRVDPYGLAMRGDAWLCVAHDYKSGERRDFNVSRIQAVEPHWPDSNGGDYSIPEEFDLELYFRDRFEALDAETVYEVHLRLVPEVLPYFESKQYHPTQQIHRSHPALEGAEAKEGQEEGGRGPAVVSFEVAGLEEMASFVRSWGESVKVLRPEALAKRIAREARAVARQYEEEGQHGSEEAPVERSADAP